MPDNTGTFTGQQIHSIVREILDDHATRILDLMCDVGLEEENASTLVSCLELARSQAWNILKVNAIPVADDPGLDPMIAARSVWSVLRQAAAVRWEREIHSCGGW